jgi:hypothetical protein
MSLGNYLHFSHHAPEAAVLTVTVARWDSYLLRSCAACGGDLERDLLDPEWYTCMACARTYKGQRHDDT